MDITKIFNIEGEPPTAGELEKKQFFSKKQSKIINWVFLGFLLFIALYAGLAFKQGDTSLAVFLIASFFSYIIFSYFNLIPLTVTINIIFLSLTFLPGNDPAIKIPMSLLYLQLIFGFAIILFLFLGCTKEKLELFQPALAKHLPSIIDWCERNSIIAVYQNKVASQGRSLVKGEYEAMKEYIYQVDEKTSSAEKQAYEKADREKLSMPIAYKGKNIDK